MLKMNWLRAICKMLQKHDKLTINGQGESSEDTRESMSEQRVQ